MPLLCECVEDQALLDPSWDVRAVNAQHCPFKATNYDDVVSDTSRCESEPADTHARLLAHYASLVVDLEYHLRPFFLERSFQATQHVDNPCVLLTLDEYRVVALIESVGLHHHLDAVNFAFIHLTLSHHRH